jgi:hypothetical protein
MVWHPRTHEQPAHRWLRGVIMDAAIGGIAPALRGGAISENE